MVSHRSLAQAAHRHIWLLRVGMGIIMHGLKCGRLME